jgi:hypothetical protein
VCSSDLNLLKINKKNTNIIKGHAKNDDLALLIFQFIK